MSEEQESAAADAVVGAEHISGAFAHERLLFTDENGHKRVIASLAVGGVVRHTCLSAAEDRSVMICATAEAAASGGQEREQKVDQVGVEVI